MTSSKIGFLPAISLVVANMIGVGVFTSLGFQLDGLKDYRAVLLIWVVGGFLALLGSLCYAELSASFPKSGGEYHFLRLAFGNHVGFLSGWTSAIVGFAAPIAAAAHAFATYFSKVFAWGIPPLFISATLIILITLIHVRSIITGSRFQVYLTVGKVALMLIFILKGLLVAQQAVPISTLNGPVLQGDLWTELNSQPFWISLIFVSYAYSGWNASAYMIDDIKNPTRNVPYSIIIGTFIVIVLYTLINYVFLLAAPADYLKGKEDVANVAAGFLFGQGGASLVSGLISFFLISTISSMILVGPRVIRRISQDYSTFRFFAASSKNEVPVRPIILQSAIALFILFTSSFVFIITSIGFILTIFTTLTAVSVIIMRYKAPAQQRPIKAPLYPLIPLAYAVFNCWIMFYTIQGKPMHALTGFAFLAIGSLIYYLIRKGSTKVNVVGIFLVLISLSACNSKKVTPPTPPQPLAVAPAPVPSADSVVDTRATILAGGRKDLLAPDMGYWIDKMNESWQRSDEKILLPIRKWREEEKISAKVGNSYGVFYPFSGPDIPFVQAIYPQGKIYFLIGLEKASDSSALIYSPHPDYGNFIRNTEQYFYFSNKLGFFRTIDMASQFSKRGVVDILAFYLKKNNCSIVAGKALRWDPTLGSPVAAAPSEANVVYLQYLNPDRSVSELYYFSKDLSDQALQQDNLWLAWVKKQLGGLKMVSLTKSASYLMHYGGFSKVRDFILSTSALQVQDDSGIGFNYILESKRPYQLYGMYTRTIPLFSAMVNPQLKSSYLTDSVKPLPFAIGYNIAHGETNLQVIY